MQSGTDPVVFRKPSDLELKACCLLVEGLKRFLVYEHPSLKFSQFVSETGLQRGVAITQNDVLPDSFVLLQQPEDESQRSGKDEQDQMLRHALIVYVGMSERGSIAMNFFVPDDSDGLNCDELMGKMNWLLQAAGALVAASVLARQEQEVCDGEQN